MSDLPEEIYSVAAVRAMDRAAIDGEGIPGYSLMTRAGAAAVSEARRRFPNAMRWQVICGAGNNAGDGYVIARLAAAEGVHVSVIAMVDPEALSGDAATAFSDFAAAGGVAASWEQAEGELDRSAGLLVDALLGSGLERDVAGDFAAAVAAINAHPAAVLAVDMPTGLHGDTGEVLGAAVRADLTVTFVALKAGLFTGAGRELAGEIAFAGLEIPAHCRTGERPRFNRISDACVERVLPVRRRNAHKGDFGHVLVIGGGEGMPGAVRLCGEAALRAGAGLVSLATHPAHATAFVGARPELMCHSLRDVKDLEQLIEKADVVAFGPGLGQSQWAAALYARVQGLAGPAVWDADALNLLAAAPARKEDRVVTPHPGEAARMLGETTAAIQGDRVAALAALRERYGGIVVLKGAGTLVSSEDDTLWLCTSGNPGMATAGMGDVLTGVIAGLLAQQIEPGAAAIAAVEIHARAGDRAAAGGERGLIASDLLGEIRGIVNP